MIDYFKIDDDSTVRNRVLHSGMEGKTAMAFVRICHKEFFSVNFQEAGSRQMKASKKRYSEN